MHWSLSGYDSPLANGQDRSALQYLESCTGVWVGKTPPLLMVRREVVFKIWSHALEFNRVRPPPLLMGRREVVCSIWSHTLEFGWVRLPPSYGQERIGLQHLESCTGV